MSGVKVENLEFGYREFRIENISFEVEKGEILAILGPNGSGKTTLLKCMASILKPRGCIYVDSLDLKKCSHQEIAKLLGYVPQMHAPSFPYRVIDVVVAGRAPHLGIGTPGKRDYEIAREVLEKLGIAELAERPYTQLSGGQLKLVLIARALAQNPRVLVLDEPTSNLDIKNKIQLYRILRDVSKDVSVILSEHDPTFASFADKILLMKNGRIVRFGKTSDVLDEKTLEEVYGTKLHLIRVNGSLHVIPAVD
ncbi:MAG: iron complex transport system ATP-binding protein [Archaeoglobi archaeon]|nr:iron complex transport system ATP-binding protein [Archaeoglobi archaeon]